MLYKSFLHFSKLQIYMASNPVFHVDYYQRVPITVNLVNNVQP